MKPSISLTAPSYFAYPPVALPFNVPGQIRVDGPPPEQAINLAALRIVTLFDPPVGVSPTPAAVGANGAFTLKIPAGSYRITLNPPQPNTYLKSIRLGDVDVLNAGLQVDRQPQDAIDILLSTNVARIDGRVLDDRREGVREVTVVLVPDLLFRKRTDLYKTAVSDASGNYQLKDVAPGDYKLFAWDDVETGAWLDPTFIRAYEDRGRPVRVSEGSNQTIDLTFQP
jgi:hypothetical protein